MEGGAPRGEGRACALSIRHGVLGRAVGSHWLAGWWLVAGRSAEHWEAERGGRGWSGGEASSAYDNSSYHGDPEDRMDILT